MARRWCRKLKGRVTWNNRMQNKNLRGKEEETACGERDGEGARNHECATLACGCVHNCVFWMRWGGGGRRKIYWPTLVPRTTFQI